MRFRHWIVGNNADRWLLLCCLVAIAALWWSLQQPLHDGPPMVSIYHGETLLAHYPLDAASPVIFHAKGDIGTSIVRIKDGSVSFVSAPCRSQRCVLSGKHQHINDLLACVPNRILVVIDGGRKTKNSPDAIAQ
ncbi:MAG: NusG domain II-containing protein [Mariprofundaceae bacterium]|nr:NusG domain II-containing protein [Mariprofundaceae bacterium]